MTLDIDITYQQPSFSLAVTCQFPNHGISGIFGPSGVGKTTLLRCIAGLEQPTSGSISFNRKHWLAGDSSMSTIRRNVGFVFQDSRLFPHLTVLENLTIVQRQIKHPKLSINKLSDQFGILALWPQRASELSAGQQQRVAIVRSLLAQPSLLLLDEPLAALDKKSKSIVMRQLKQHSIEHCLAMIYVSHSATEIAQLCDSLLLMTHEGTMEFGDATTLLHQYKHLGDRVEITNNNTQQHQITLTLSPSQYQHYKELGHIFISGDKEL